jgi:hypothetical protein
MGASTLKIRVGWLAAAGIAIGLIAVYWLHRSSFCFADFRFRSDEEQMMTALESIVRKSHATKIPRDHIDDVRVPYSSVEELKKENPNCCEDVSSNIGVYYSHIDVFFGYVSRAILEPVRN